MNSTGIGFGSYRQGSEEESDEEDEDEDEEDEEERDVDLEATCETKASADCACLEASGNERRRAGDAIERRWASKLESGSALGLPHFSILESKFASAELTLALADNSSSASAFIARGPNETFLRKRLPASCDDVAPVGESAGAPSPCAEGPGVARQAFGLHSARVCKCLSGVSSRCFNGTGTETASLLPRIALST